VVTLCRIVLLHRLWVEVGVVTSKVPQHRPKGAEGGTFAADGLVVVWRVIIPIRQPASLETQRGNPVHVPSRARPTEGSGPHQTEQSGTLGKGLGTSEELTHVGGPFAALGHTFEILTTDTELGQHLELSLRDLRAKNGARPATTYMFVSNAPEPWVYALYVDGEQRVESENPEYVLDFLFWHINRQAIERTQGHVILHAGGVERDGLACVLAAESECGKTTLTTGLLRRGFKYITDEAVAIHPTTLLISPFPKPLSIDRGSWDVLRELKPKTSQTYNYYPADQWQIPASSIRHDIVVGLTAPKVLITPKYIEGAQTVLSPVGRAEMLMRLAKLTFHFQPQARRNLAVLRRLVSTSFCFQLTMGDLDAACHRVEWAMDRAV
jgi:hypothetical protein